LSDSVFIGRQAKGYTTAPALNKYTKVIINIDDDNYVEAGDGDNVLEVSCPWGTPGMAADILANIGDYSYQPYDTDWAKLDPAAELGDSVTINGVFSGIYANETSFSRLMAARISAPQDNAVDHEYPYKSPTVRKTERQLAQTRASLKVNADSIAAEVEARTASETEMRAVLSLYADEIAARVTKTGGDSASFGWSLTADGFILSSNGQQVFKATENGVDITGRITAKSGFIGNGESGFTITDTAIYNTLSSLYDSTGYGVYIGTDGIALGSSFRVDASGNLYADSGTFTGNVYANQILVGGAAGYISGGQIGSGTISGGWGGNIGYGAVTTDNTTSGINTSLTNADNAYNAIFGWGNISVGTLNVTKIVFQGYTVKHGVISYKNASGNTEYLNVMYVE